ncbi:MAG TPA: DinB family protein [Terriglobales bacterium]|nr:DinB family protein [Terriglobales bacterium]
MSTTPASAKAAITPQYADIIRTMNLQTLQNEFATTAKVIRAVPDAKSSYKPDPNAKSAAELAWHIASSEIWFLDSIANGKFVPGAENDYKNPGTIEGIAAWYEKETKRGVEAVAKLSPDQLVQPLDFFGAFQLPTFAYLTFQLVHGVHHRGQLSTYLRPMGSKVPSIYGGSFDDPWKG